jgi:hypothetical protein
MAFYRNYFRYGTQIVGIDEWEGTRLVQPNEVADGMNGLVEDAAVAREEAIRAGEWAIASSSRLAEQIVRSADVKNRSVEARTSSEARNQRQAARLKSLEDQC